MRYVVVNLLLLLVLYIPSTVFSASCVQTNNTLNGVAGLDAADGTIYASINSTSNECSCTYVRIFPANTNADMALSILLAAGIAGREVRVDFLEQGNCDSGYRVYLEAVNY